METMESIFCFQRIAFRSLVKMMSTRVTAKWEPLLVVSLLLRRVFIGKLGDRFMCGNFRGRGQTATLN